MPKHFRDLEKMLVGGGYAQIFYRLEKCWGGGVCQQIYGLEKCWGGGGGVMPKYFRDLKKNVGGGEGHNCQFWSGSLILSTF